MPNNETLLVGFVALVLAVLIGLRIRRGLRTGRLPLYRTYFDRSADTAKFNALLALHAISLALVAFIAADLLLGLGFRD